MTQRYATRDALLALLSDEPCIGRLIIAMWMTHRVASQATREQVRRLCRAGVVERFKRGCYRVGAPPEALDTTPAVLGHNLRT